MGCREVRDRLVAWQDDELSRGEAAQLEDHLRSCAECRRKERALADARPEPGPEAVRAALDVRLDVDLLLAAARTPPAAPTPIERLRAWMGREARVPMGLVVAYVAVLFAAIGFGLSALLPGSPPATTLTDVQPIPADQFRPAAWDLPAEEPAAVE